MQVTRARQIPVTLAIAAVGWLLMTVQEILLFARPTPYGGPYVSNWDRYFFYALLFNFIGPMLAAVPALAWCASRPAAPVSRLHSTRLHRLTTGLVALVVILDHSDNEVMRFMGTHLTPNLLATYGDVAAWGSDMRHIFATDKGGPWLPFVILAASPLALWYASRRIVRLASTPARASVPWSHARTAGALLLFLGVPTLVYNLPGGRFRRSRVQPELLTLVSEWRRTSRSGIEPPDLATLASTYQQHWLVESGDSAWGFVPGTRYPFLRFRRESVPVPAAPWNVIYLQLETFRGWNVGFLNPDGRNSATPFLDSLAAAPGNSWWSRFLSFGPPTVSGFVAGHCSVAPHSDRSITTAFPYTTLICLPAVLRSHGWHTAYFTGSDPDWDSQTLWLNRWYEEWKFYRDANEDDRVIFQDAARRIRELGRRPQPFFATVVSISNHYPFRSREPSLDIGTGSTPTEAVRNTMHYTDEVVREFVTGLAGEPWFRHTLLVIVGDHGYNLGEHDGTPGQRNGWRESVWVPLLIAGPHPRLPPGRQDGVASLIDVAPTVLDLLGLQDTVPWMGHSLVGPQSPARAVTGAHGPQQFAERGQWSLVVDANTGARHLYQALTDPLQRDDLGKEYPDTAGLLERRMLEDQTLVDYLLESDRIAPPSPSAVSQARSAASR
jgi:hypothetical protein